MSCADKAIGEMQSVKATIVLLTMLASLWDDLMFTDAFLMFWFSFNRCD